VADETACTIDELDEKGRGHCPHSLIEASGGECRLWSTLRPGGTS